MSRDEETPTHVPETGGLGCLVRFAWLIVGHGAILLSLVWAFQSQRTGFAVADVVLWGAVVACIALRYLDVSRLNGLTATGRPASIADWRRYALILITAALVLWGAAHGTTLIRMWRS